MWLKCKFLNIFLENIDLKIFFVKRLKLKQDVALCCFSACCPQKEGVMSIHGRWTAAVLSSVQMIKLRLLNGKKRSLWGEKWNNRIQGVLGLIDQFNTSWRSRHTVYMQKWGAQRPLSPRPRKRRGLGGEAPFWSTPKHGNMPINM